MTTYAHDPDRSTIVAAWPTGDGSVARTAARVPKNLAPALARRTAVALTALSARLWLAYSERAVHEIHPFRLVEAVRFPNQPVGNVLRIVEDDDVEAVHALGRLVSRAPGRAFRDAVVAEVRAELDAVLAADGGTLTGRARQGVAHPRPDAPAEQVGAAHTLLHADPLGPWELLSTVEPNAAAVAALRWLRAAAVLVAGVVGHTVADVVALAEAIGHEDLRVARQVLDPAHRATDEEVIRDVLQEAVLAARGYFVLCPERHEPFDPDPGPGGAHRHRAVVTLLDPAAPAACLLDGLVRGLQGCFRVYVDEIVRRERPGGDRPLVTPDRAAELRTRYVAELREAVRMAR